MDSASRRSLPAALIGKITALPLHRIAEVEDFVDFIGEREESRALAHATASIGAPTFAAVWDNPEDDVYDAF